jgi:predicted alpha/beta superfamily hydrolase
MKNYVRNGLALACALAAATVPPASANPTPGLKTSPVAPGATAQSSRQFDFTSKINGGTYRIRVALPQAPAPVGGYPVLYVLDGDGYFGLFADALLIRAAVAPEVQAAIVVGIGYPTDDVLVTLNRRVFDLTPTTDANIAKWMKPYKGNPVRFGGSDQFLQVIQREIAPEIAKLATVNPKKRILWGHSLGGLFVLNTLFTTPNAFETYVALSPSFPYDNDVVLKNEDRFRQQLAAGSIAPRVFIGVGSRELGLPFDVKTSRRGMSSNAGGDDPISRLANRLSGYSGPTHYQSSFTLFEGETHTSMPFAAINPVIEFSLPMASDHAKPAVDAN